MSRTPKAKKSLENAMNTSESKSENADAFPGSPVDAMDVSGMIGNTNMIVTRPQKTIENHDNDDMVKSSIFCISDCKLSHRKNMIRCMHCMLWCHLRCVGEPNSYQGVWSCFECRVNSKQNSALSGMVAELLTQVRDLNITVADIRNDTSLLKSELKSTNENLSKLKSENSSLKAEILSLRAKQTAAAPVTTNNITTDLLIGSSVIRNVDADSANELQINCLPGLKFKGVHDKITELISLNRKYDTVHIIAGTSDSKLSDSSPQTIANDAKEAVETALKLANNVQLSSILPRLDDETASQKAETANVYLKELCEQNEKVTFCNLSGSFVLADGNVNDALLMPDGVHPNYNGTQKIIANMKLPAKVRRFQPRQQPEFNRRIPPLLSSGNYQGANQWMQRQSQYRRQPWNQPDCKNCLENGHDTYQCPRTARLMCYNCRSIGHKQQHCRS
jgi:hypothetical protein